MELTKPLGYYTDNTALRFHMLDVGEGLMILIIFPNDQVMLFDCNVTDDNESTILDYLSANIPFKINPATGNAEQFIDVFVNSHRDEDHYRGLKKINAQYPIQSIWDSGQTGATTKSLDYEYYMGLRRRLKEKDENNLKVLVPTETPVATFNGVEIFCFAGKEDFQSGFDNGITVFKAAAKIQHTNSIVLKISYGGRDILLTGDSDWKSWKEKIVPNFKKTVKSDILVASHHGSRSFFTDEANDTIDIQKNPDTTYMEAIEYIDPDVTLISCGKYETYHHPNEEAEALYKKYSSQANAYGYIPVTAELFADLKAVALNCGDTNPLAWNEFMVFISGKGEKVEGVIDTTLGRCLFNEILPQDLGYVDRSKEENLLLPEVDFHVGKKQLKDILQHVINTHGTTRTAEVLDDIKAMGYKYSTRAAMTVSISEMTVPPVKKQLIADAEKKVEQININYNRGRSTDEERYKNVIRVWQETDKTLLDALLSGLDKYNNIFMMADSGARGSNQQIKQLAGMRGLMADTSGHTIELPIKSNFREGLDVLEYFISAHGARKGLSDTALRTADSGYLTRRLVDVSQDLIIRETDCSVGKIIPGMYVYSFVNDRATNSSDAKEDILEPLQERITGRYLAEDIKDPATGEIIVAANHLVTPKRAAAIIKTGVTQVKIRTILTCRSQKVITFHKFNIFN